MELKFILSGIQKTKLQLACTKHFLRYNLKTTSIVVQKLNIAQNLIHWDLSVFNCSFCSRRYSRARKVRERDSKYHLPLGNLAKYCFVFMIDRKLLSACVYLGNWNQNWNRSTHRLETWTKNINPTFIAW